MSELLGMWDQSDLTGGLTDNPLPTDYVSPEERADLRDYVSAGYDEEADARRIVGRLLDALEAAEAKVDELAPAAGRGRLCRADTHLATLSLIREHCETYRDQWHPNQKPEPFDQGVGAACQDVLALLDDQRSWDGGSDD